MISCLPIQDREVVTLPNRNTQDRWSQRSSDFLDVSGKKTQGLPNIGQEPWVLQPSKKKVNL